MTQTIGMPEASIVVIIALLAVQVTLFRLFKPRLGEMHADNEWVHNVCSNYDLAFLIALVVDGVAIIANVMGKGSLQTILFILVVLLVPFFPGAVLYLEHVAAKKHPLPSDHARTL